MKPLERIPILANVLIVAYERPATEVGKLVKALSFSTELGENSFALNMAIIFIFQEMLLLWQYR